MRLQNWEKSADIWLVLAVQIVMPVGYTILLLSAKQSRENQCNEASRLKKMYQKSSALSIRFEMLQRCSFTGVCLVQ
jgi:Tfp pilus assembly protein PilO